MLRQSRLQASRASHAQKSRGLRLVLSKNFSRAAFFVFWVTYLVDIYLSYLPMKQIWWKSAVCPCNVLMLSSPLSKKYLENQQREGFQNASYLRWFTLRRVTKIDMFLLSKIWYIKIKFWNSITYFPIVLNYNSPCSIWNKPKTTSKKLFDEHSVLNCYCYLFFYLCQNLFDDQQQK